MLSRPTSNVLRLSSFLVAVALASGCVAVVPYSPKTNLVGDIGAEEANRRLNELMVQSLNPPIVSARIDGNILTYEFNQVIIGAFWTQSQVTGKRSINLTVLDKVELYENGVVYIYEQGRVVQQIHFPSVEVGREVADLIESFKASNR